MTNIDRRRYFRVDDKATVSFKILNEEEKENLGIQLNSNCIDPLDNQRLYLGLEGDFQGLLFKLKDSFPETIKIFEVLNKKINLLAKVSRLQEKEENLMEKSPQEINLSACGLAFYNPVAINSGVFLRIELILLPDARYLLVMGRVVHCEKHPLGYRVAINIEAMRQADTELLIQHIMKREAEMLKLRRQSTG